MDASSPRRQDYNKPGVDFQAFIGKQSAVDLKLHDVRTLSLGIYHWQSGLDAFAGQEEPRRMKHMAFHVDGLMIARRTRPLLFAQVGFRV